MQCSEHYLTLSDVFAPADTLIWSSCQKHRLLENGHEIAI